MSDKARWTVGAADPSGNSWDVFKTASPREALDKLEELQAGPRSLVSRKGNQVYYVYDKEEPERGDCQLDLEEMLDEMPLSPLPGCALDEVL